VNGAPLEIEGLCFRIGEFALRDVSLSVGAGRYFVLTGPNGSGKTLLLRLIAGLHTPSAGSVRIGGEPVTHVPPWRRRIGYMPQDGLLFPNRTGARNSGCGLEVRGAAPAAVREEVARISDMLGVAALLDRMPQGLSGGERQKVGLARALAPRPSLLLLDEPLSAIDEDSRDRLAGELRRLQRELALTTVHVAHTRREIELVADRVGSMDTGRLTAVTDA